MDRLATPVLGNMFSTGGWSVEELFTARVLRLGLWIGLVVLSLALLILMRTRWGQAKPLSKCVVLSVFAHLLLFGYAYETKFILDCPTIVREEVIDVALAPDENRPEPDGDPDIAEKPEEELAAPLGGAGELAAPARRVNHRPGEPSRSQPDDSPKIAAAPLADSLPTPEPAPPVPEPPRDDLRKSASRGADPTPIEAPAAARRAEADPLVPNEALLERRNVTRVSQPQPQRSVLDELPSEITDPGSRLQRLADVAPKQQAGDAVADRRDDLAQAPNDGASPASQQPRGESQGPLTDTSNQLVSVDLPNTISKLESSWAPRRAQHRPPSADADEPAPRRLGDGEPVPAPLRLRLQPDRGRAAEQFGGNGRTQSAVAAALAWLAKHQEHDGRWDCSTWGGGQETKVRGHDREGAGSRADTGITGLALLAFLAAGHTHLEGEYRQNVQHGLEYLLRTQSNDGNLAGQARLYETMYCHGMASLAMSEAYLLTGDYRLKPPVERATQYTVNAQHRGSGGWRYQPGDLGDMSQFGWQVMALLSAEMAGIPIPSTTRDGMLRFLQSASSGTHGGLASYRPRERPSRSMTAEALACRLFLALADDEAAIQEAAAFVSEEMPDSGQANLYYWYYATLALFQLQGDQWRRWNAALQERLLNSQRTDGDWAGSWDTNTVWGGYGGRVYTTAMAALSLEVYYRYLPLYKRGR